MHTAQRSPREVTGGSQQCYRAMFKVNNRDILISVKLSSCDLAVLELWGLKSKYDNMGERSKSIHYYTNAHILG